jgi:hypothetical protein
LFYDLQWLNSEPKVKLTGPEIGFARLDVPPSGGTSKGAARSTNPAT